jgi:quercetin dioxygenase-like cupin family protein
MRHGRQGFPPLAPRDNRVTELTLAPGGHVGEHNHEGPGIRQVTSGYMTYVLPDKTVVYGPGDFSLNRAI